MPRRRRSWVPGTPTHIISRFIDRRFALVDDDDRRVVLELIGRYQPRWDWKWLSWGLMSSHTHYGTLAGTKKPQDFYHPLNTSFASRFHRGKEGRTLGHVFADRPAIHTIGRERACRLVAYHHRNPSEAGVVDRPRDSRWTSHRVYLRLDPAPWWLDVEWALSMLGFADTEAGRRRFDEFVTEVDLDDWFVGGAETSARHAPEAHLLTAPPPSIEWEALLAGARQLVGISPLEAISSRSHQAANARRLVALVATRRLGQSQAEVARRLGMRRGSVAKLLQRRGRSVDLAVLTEQLAAMMAGERR